MSTATTHIKTDKQLVPTLRFKEFDANLIKVGFTDVGKIMIGLTHTPTYINEGKPFLSSKNISGGYIDFENIQYISEEKYASMPESTKPKKGDILFTRVGSNLGNPIVLDIDIEFGVFVSLGFFRVNKKAHNLYIQKWMASNYFWRQLEQKVAGGAKNNLNTGWLKEFKLNLPTIPEQQKIASFLSAVDEKIQQLTKKKQLLEQYKKGVMQQLFSGQLRFKDENGNPYPDWDEKRLGEVATFLKGKGISKADLSDEGVLECIRYGELYTVYGETIIEVVSRTNVAEKELVMSEKDDVIIPASGETQIDIATASCVLKANIALGGDLNIIRSANNGVFLAYYLNSALKFDIARLSQGVSVVHLYSSQLKTLKIGVPQIEEQQKIATYLSRIDIKIEAVNNQISQTQSFKKGLLQQMFVAA